MTLGVRVALLLLVAGLPWGCRPAGRDQAAQKAPEAALSAQELLAQRRGAEAAWEYQEELARRPGDALARVGLAAALGLLRLMELAIPLLEELLEAKAPPVDARRALAELYLVTGRPEKAKAVLESDPAVRQSPPALLSLGRSCLAIPRPDEAREAFLAYRRLEPESAEADYWLGEAHWAAGLAEEARRHWRQGAERAPDDPRFPLRLGESFRDDPAPGSDARAEAFFREALRRAPEDAAALHQLGLLYLSRGRPRDAARQLLLAIQSAPSNPEPHLSLAEALSALGETARAHRHRGLYYSLTDRPARAVAAYEALGRARPDSTDAPILISQAYVQMQQNERAAAVVSKALARAPDDPELLENLSALYLLTLSRNEAEATARKWLAVQPEAARPRWMLGRVALAMNRVEEAVRFFQEAHEREPEEPEYRAALGGALLRLATPEGRARGTALLRRAAAARPHSATYQLQLAAALRQAREWEAARQACLAALNTDPAEPAAYHGMVLVAQARKEWHQVRLWSQALRVVQDRARELQSQRRAAIARPRDAAVFYRLAQTLVRIGDLSGARWQLEEALALRPGWAEAEQLLARVRRLRAAL